MFHSCTYAIAIIVLAKRNFFAGVIALGCLHKASCSVSYALSSNPSLQHTVPVSINTCNKIIVLNIFFLPLPAQS